MLGVVPLARTRLDSADAALTGGAPTPVIPGRSPRGRAKEVPSREYRDPPPLHRAHRGHVPDDPVRQEEAAGRPRRCATHMQPGTGVRTIGGMYATVKEVREDTVLLEVGARRRTPLFAKNAIGAVLDDEEYNRIVHGIDATTSRSTDPSFPDDASSLTRDRRLRRRVDGRLRQDRRRRGRRRRRRGRRRAADEAEGRRGRDGRGARTTTAEGDEAGRRRPTARLRRRVRVRRSAGPVTGLRRRSRSPHHFVAAPAALTRRGAVGQGEREGGSTEEGPKAPGGPGQAGARPGPDPDRHGGAHRGDVLLRSHALRVWASTSPAVRASRSRPRTSPASRTRSTRPT